MIPFLKINKNLITYSLIFLIVVPIFGINFLISFIGNMLLLLLLIPLLIFLIAFISFNSFKSKVKTCNKCGTTSFSLNDTCMNCGADLGNLNIENCDELNKPSETTIEVKAEEVK